jgi:hypothetical protein
MTDDDWPRPRRREPRGEFPPHPGPPADPGPLSGPAALEIARRHLAEWIAEHGGTWPIGRAGRD